MSSVSGTQSFDPTTWQYNINETSISLVNHINPLSPNGDQHQFSPNVIHTKSRDKVMRIDKMITKVKLH